MSIINRYLLSDKDCEKIAQYLIANKDQIPQRKRMLSAAELLADLKAGLQLTKRWQGNFEKERAGESIHNQSWAHRVLSNVLWSKMRYVTSIDSHVKTDNDLGGLSEYRAVAFLTLSLIHI